MPAIIKAMKQDIHPTYYPNAKVTCACGASFIVGSTKPVISVEICSHCHPFFTGQEKLIDTAGKVEKFKARRAKAAEVKVKSVRVTKSRSKSKTLKTIEE